MFFQLLSTTKVNLVAKIMQSAYLCVIFHVKHKKLPFLAVLTYFLFLVKYKMATSQAPSSATTLKIYLNLLKRSKAFH